MRCCFPGLLEDTRRLDCLKSHTKGSQAMPTREAAPPTHPVHSSFQLLGMPSDLYPHLQNGALNSCRTTEPSLSPPAINSLYAGLNDLRDLKTQKPLPLLNPTPQNPSPSPASSTPQTSRPSSDVLPHCRGNARNHLPQFCYVAALAPCPQHKTQKLAR